MNNSTVSRFRITRAAVVEAEDSLPASPEAQFQRLLLRFIQGLGLADRGRFRPAGMVLVFAGLCGLALSALAGSSGGGFFAFSITVVGAVLFAWRSPAGLQVVLGNCEREFQRLQEQFHIDCSAASELSQSRCLAAVRQDAETALHEGDGFQTLAESAAAFALEMDEVAERQLSEAERHRQEAVKSTESSERLRRALALHSSGWASRLFPGYRKDARALAQGSKSLAATSTRRVRIETRAKIYHAIATEARRMGILLKEVKGLSASGQPILDPVGSALGSPLPPKSELQQEARQCVDKHLPQLRCRVLAGVLDGQSPQAAMDAAIENGISTWPHPPTTVSAYADRLNGKLDRFGEQFWLEASEQLPVRVRPGRQRFRVGILMGPPPTSQLFQAVARRCRDVATVGSAEMGNPEHGDEELLGLSIEVGLSILEVPELASLLEEFRALPIETQRKFITCCPDPDAVLAFRPELPNTGRNDASSLLDTALALQLLTRDGSAQLLWDGVLVARGYTNAQRAIADDPDLAAKIAEAIRSKSQKLGSSEVIQLLREAKKSALVPVAHTATFRAHLDEQIARLTQNPAVSLAA